MKKKQFIIITVVVALFAVLVGINYYQRSSALEDLPNYTEIRGTINLDGIQYDKQPRLGSTDAKVKVVEFADFKCPACKQWERTYFDQFVKEFVDTGKVELFFMNFAFIDRDSIMAASAGEAIFKQSNEKFWEFQKKLYAHQKDEKDIWATQKFLLSFVKENISGIDYSKFEEDLTNHTYMLDVKEDFKIAGSLGVNGTPKFMVNGELLPTSDYDELAAAINNILSK